MLVNISKKRWENLASKITNKDDAVAFFNRYAFNYVAKEGALRTFKHAVLETDQQRRIQEGIEVNVGKEDPDDQIEWLNELSIDMIPNQ